MNNKNTGGPAFPVTSDVDAQNEAWGGMTLRDYFAAKALQGFCANPAVFAANGMSGWGLVNCDPQGLSEYCGNLADAMIVELNKCIN